MKVLNKKIKKALSRPVPDWDDKEMWTNIEKELPKENRKPILFFMRFLIIGILIIAAALSYNYLSHSSKTTTNENFPHQVDTLTSTTKEKLTKPTENTTNSININTNEAAVYIDKTTSHKTDNSQHRKPTAVTISSKSISESNENKSLISSRSQQENIASIFNETNVQKVKTFKNEVVEKKNVKPTIHSITLLPMIPPRFLTHAHNHPNLNTKINSNIPTNFSLSDRWMIGFSFGGYYTTRTLSSSTQQNWVNHKNKADEMLETLEGSLTIEKFFNNHISLATGLNYKQTVEYFSASDTITTIEEIYSDTATYNITSGHFSGGMVNKTISDIRSIKTPNRYSFISIPVIANYNLNLGKGFLKIGTGININLWSKFDGYTYDYAGIIDNDEQKNLSLYKNSIGIRSAILQAGYHFPLYNNWSANIGFKSIWDITSNIKDKNISHRYKLYGLTVGVFYVL